MCVGCLDVCVFAKITREPNEVQLGASVARSRGSAVWVQASTLPPPHLLCFNDRLAAVTVQRAATR